MTQFAPKEILSVLAEEDPKIMEKALVRIATVRVGAVREYPMLGRGLYAMTPIPVWGLRFKSGASWAMDKYARIYFDPEVVAGDDPEVLESIESSIASFIHETWHWLRRHPERLAALPFGPRGEAPNPVRANLATDAEINGQDKYLRAHLPEDCVWPEKLVDRRTGACFPRNTAETFEYFYKWMEWPEEDSGEGGEPCEDGEPGQGPGGDSPGEGKGNGESNRRGERNKRVAEENPLGGDLPGTTKGKRDWELPPPTEDGEIPGVRAGDDDSIRKATAREIQESARIRGTVPGHWESWAGAEVSPPKIPWQSKLQQFIRESRDRALGASNYTYSKRSRRQSSVSGNVILPAVFRPRVDVAVVIDTSGSMSDEDLAACCSECSGILRAVGASAMVVTGDTQVGFAEKVTSVGNVSLVGRGGTNMVPLIQRALESRPQCIVVLTDGYTPWPREGDIRVPVVACLIGKHCGEHSIPRWIHPIVVED